MSRAIIAVIIVFLVIPGPSGAAKKEHPLPVAIAPEAITYAFETDRIDPAHIDWQPIAEVNWGELPHRNECWVRILFPEGDWEKPALYVNGFLGGLEAWLGETRIYPAGRRESPGPKKLWGPVPLNHIIPLPLDTPLSEPHPARYLFLRIAYANPYDIGSIDAIYAGEIEDLLSLSETSTLDMLRFHLLLLCLGAVLFFTGGLFLAIFLFRIKDRLYPLLSFGFFALVAGICYLNLVPLHAAFGFSPGTWFAVEVIASFLLPVGMVAFIEQIFVSALGPLLRRLWQFQIVLTLGVTLWLKFAWGPFFIIPIRDLTALIGIIAGLTAIYKSGRQSALSPSASRITTGCALAFLGAAMVDIAHEFGLVGFGGYFYGFGILALLLSFGYVLLDHYRTTAQKARAFALALEVNKQKMLQLEQAGLEARFEALKSQLNPHFLFNTLGTLIGLIEEDRDLAISYVEELSRVYRYLLQTRNERLLTVARELEFIASYAFLVSKRFGDQLKVRVDVPEAYLQRRIPPLSLQLLVENALKHNVISSQSPLGIDILADDGEYIAVRNNLQKKASFDTSHRIGLANLENQYQFFSKKVVVMEDDASFTVKIPLLDTMSAMEKGKS